ncbi:MAG: KAP family NTPase [Bacilli bacterium]|nr:KAP family NTPase [Bacilli bacterium]
MISSNPFSMTFGIEPNNYISRKTIQDKIVEEFTADSPSNFVYLLSGVRGSGKTVLLSNLSEKFSSFSNFIVVDPFNKANILESIASQLYEHKEVKRVFVKKQISFSFHGISLNLSGERPISSVVALLKEMIEILQNEGKRILITIDEVDNSQEMKTFIETYQSLLRYKYPVFLLMTGLFENISKLQEDKSLTFLYRAPKLFLDPLDVRSMTVSYSNLLNLPVEETINFAKMTKGFAYAYQTLGYLLFEGKNKKLDASVINEFDQTMCDYVYEKIYSELTKTERDIILSIKSEDPVRCSFVYEQLKMDIKTFSVYRDKLIKKGVLKSSSYGYIEFALPRFYQFLLFK